MIVDVPRKLDSSPFAAVVDKDWNPARALQLLDRDAMDALVPGVERAEQADQADQAVNAGFILAAQGVKRGAQAGIAAQRVNRLRSSYA